MSHRVRLESERREREALSPYAALSSESMGRPREEPHDPVRTVFQRDRDRILHCKSFRRLKHKTQVFISPEGDHYRTRLTHTLEVAQIARTVARALRLNEDLAEAIALGHDLGHPPFGHAGEQALDEAIREHRAAHPSDDEPTGFRHYEQSLRVVDVLEDLNLSEETRLGISGHSKGRKDLTAFDGEPTSTLEAAVVRISDRIAYVNHDLDDSLRAGIVIDVPKRFTELGASISNRIGAMVEDVVENSLDRPEIRLSNGMLAYLNDLKEWLFENVYLSYPRRDPDQTKAQRIVKHLFAHYMTPGALPEGFEGIQGAVDFVAGMTDRYAIQTFSELCLPSGFREF